jgi:integrase/recombinase XerD
VSGPGRYRLGHPLVDGYLEFVADRARANTLRAVTFDLKASFEVIVKDPVHVVGRDVFEFLAHQLGEHTSAERHFTAPSVRR